MLTLPPAFSSPETCILALEIEHLNNILEPQEPVV
jgi:hypothetical protein